MKKTTYLITALILIIVGLTFLRVVVLNGMSTSGFALNKTEKELISYKIQNAVLREKLLSTTSFEHIASTASSLGFVESKANLSLEKSIPLAIKQ